MSRLWLNIRFGFWHLQIGDPKWWSVHIGRNASVRWKNWGFINDADETIPYVKLFQCMSPWSR